MSTLGDVVSVVTGGGFLGILAKLLADWLRSRRRERAQDEVAEGSVASTLAERNLSALDGQIVSLEKANALERASYERRIKALEADVGRLTHERDGLLQSVDLLRMQMGEMQRRLDAMKAEMDVLARIDPRRNPPTPD